MTAAKKRTKTPSSASPSAKTHATRTRAAARAADDPATVLSPSPSPKPRSCRTCGGPMRGHNKTDCALSKNSPAALEAKVAAAEEAVLAEHTDYVSMRIDDVLQGLFEATDGKASSAAVLAALAEAGLTIPEGKTLADFVPARAADDSDDEEDCEDAPSAGGVAAVDDAGSRGVTPAAAGAAGADMNAGVPITPPATPRPGEDAMDVSGDETRDSSARAAIGVDQNGLPTPPTSSAPAAAPALVKVIVKSRAPKYRLKYGWKATPNGLLPMELERNGLKRQEYPTQAEKAKRIPRMFQAVAQKGDTLASRTGGWAFAVFLPRGGAGIMRTWHSQQVETDVPGLMSDVRRLVFDKLQPFREQYLKSLEDANKKAKLEADFWKARAEEREKENAELRRKLGIA